jgi:hypothetical protein
MGERIKVEVSAYVTLAKRVLVRVLQIIQKQGYRIATMRTGSLGIEPDSATARRRKAPANPRAALPMVEKTVAEPSRWANRGDPAPGRAVPGAVLWALRRPFESGNPSLDETLLVFRTAAFGPAIV